VGNQRHQFPMADQVVDQVVGLVDVLVEVPVVDREEEDREEVDLEEVDRLEEGHVHPVRDWEQVVQACGVE
jgi:hypothetical protein